MTARSRNPRPSGRGGSQCGHTKCRAYTQPAPSERTAQKRAAAAWGMTQGDQTQ